MKNNSKVVCVIVRKIKELETIDKKLGEYWTPQISVYNSTKWVKKKDEIESKIAVLEEILDEVL